MHDPAIEILKPAPRAFITRTAEMRDIGQAMADGFGELGRLFAKAKVPMTGTPMAHYIAYDTTSTTFELGFPCRLEETEALRGVGLSIGSTPSGRVLKATHIGPYNEVARTYDGIMAEMKARGFTPAQDMWEVYFSPPGTPPAQTRTDILWPTAA